MRIPWIISAVAVASLTMSGCGTYQNIYSNYDKSIDFSLYKTFAWAPDSGKVIREEEFQGSPYDNDIVRNNAKNYVTLCLSQRGYLVDIDSPDFIMQLVLLNEKKEKVVTYRRQPYSGYYFYHPYFFPYYYPYYRYYTWYGWPYPPFWDNEEVSYTNTYVKGTITINMYDRELAKLVWTGSAEGDIYDPAYIQYDVHPAIDRIMKKFPVKPIHRQRGPEDLQFKNRIVRTNGLNGNHFREAPDHDR